MRNIWLITLLAAALPGLQAQGPKPKTEVGTTGKVAATNGSSEKQGAVVPKQHDGDEESKAADPGTN